MVVFGSIINEGYVNIGSETLHCVFNKNSDACNYGVTIGLIAFLACIFFFVLDMKFQQISSIKDRKKAVMLEIGFSGKAWKILYICGKAMVRHILILFNMYLYVFYLTIEICLTFDAFVICRFMDIPLVCWFLFLG